MSLKTSFASSLLIINKLIKEIFSNQIILSINYKINNLNGDLGINSKHRICLPENHRMPVLFPVWYS